MSFSYLWTDDQTENQGVKQRAWVEYLFPNLYTNDGEILTLSTCTEAEMEERIAHFGTQAYVAESDEDIFKAGTSFESFYHQAKYPLSNMALFVGFLMLWLKHCIVSSTPQKALSVSAVYLVIFLVYGRPLGLLLAMACEILSGLKALMT